MPVVESNDDDDENGFGYSTSAHSLFCLAIEREHISLETSSNRTKPPEANVLSQIMLIFDPGGESGDKNSVSHSMRSDRD